MIPIDQLLLFFAASLALAIAPGPDNIFVLTQSALFGARAGLLVMAGLLSGLLFHISAVALGVAALLSASPVAFTALKVVGAGYLLYLAQGAWRDSGEGLQQRQGEKLSAGALYRRGVVMNVTNPKVALFFLAFLPQFAAPEQGSVAVQIVLLGATFMVAALLVFSGVAFAGGALGGWLHRSKRGVRWVNRTAALVFLLLAARLLLLS